MEPKIFIAMNNIHNLDEAFESLGCEDLKKLNSEVLICKKISKDRRTCWLNLLKCIAESKKCNLEEYDKVLKPASEHQTSSAHKM